MTIEVKKDEKEEVIVTIDENEEVNEEVSGLTPEEQAMAEKHGLVKKEEDEKPEDKEDKEDKEETEDKKLEQKPDEKPDEKKPVKHSTDLETTFTEWSSDPEKEHQGLKEYSSEQRSFYYKWKNDKRKRQEAEAKAEILEIELNKTKAQLNNKSRDPLDRILEEDEARKPLTKKEYEEDKQRAQEAENIEISRRQRMASHNSEAKVKYADYDKVLNMAMEVMRNDESGTYWETFRRAAENPKANSAEVAYNIGKLHPNYGTEDPAPDGEDIEKANKMKENAQRGISSTSIAENRSGRRNIPEKELTITDCNGMTTKKWMSLSRETRDRLLQESCA